MRRQGGDTQRHFADAEIYLIVTEMAFISQATFL